MIKWMEISPAFLPREALVEQGQDLRHVELHVFQIQVFLIVLLHLEQVVEFEIKLQQATGTTCANGLA